MRGDSDVLLPRVELSSLFPDAAAAYVVRPRRRDPAGATVGGIASRGRRRASLRSGYTEEHFAAAVIAVGPHQLDASAGGDTANRPRRRAGARQRREFTYEPIVTAYLKYEGRWACRSRCIKLDGAPGTMDVRPRTARRPAGLAAVVISTDMPGDANAGSGHAAARHRCAAAAAHARRCRRRAWIKVIAERRATYACRAGLARPLAGMHRAAASISQATTPTPDFPATLEAATRSGVARRSGELSSRRAHDLRSPCDLATHVQRGAVVAAAPSRAAASIPNRASGQISVRPPQTVRRRSNPSARVQRDRSSVVGSRR